MLTVEEFDKIPDGAIFRMGLISDSVTGCNIDGSDKLLKFVAKKGNANDWAVYVGRDEESSYDEVRYQGGKTFLPVNILNCVPCTTEVLKRYRP